MGNFLSYKSSDLMQAVDKGNPRKVQKIIGKTHTKFEQTYNEHGLTPLQLAAQNGSTEILTIMINNDFSRNTPDGSCWFPLHHACSNGHGDVVKLLTSEDMGSEKADVNNHCVVDICKCAKQTALHVACAKGYYNCVVILLTLGADVTIRDKNKRTAYDVAVKNKRKDIVEYMKPFLNAVEEN